MWEVIINCIFVLSSLSINKFYCHINSYSSCHCHLCICVACPLGCVGHTDMERISGKDLTTRITLHLWLFPCNFCPCVGEYSELRFLSHYMPLLYLKIKLCIKQMKVFPQLHLLLCKQDLIDIFCFLLFFSLLSLSSFCWLIFHIFLDSLDGTTALVQVVPCNCCPCPKWECFGAHCLALTLTWHQASGHYHRCIYIDPSCNPCSWLYGKDLEKCCVAALFLIFYLSFLFSSLYKGGGHMCPLPFPSYLFSTKCWC